MRKLMIIILFLNGATIWAASHHPRDFLNTISGSPDEGEKIVQHYCSNCHAKKPLIPLGAPRIGLPTDWEPRKKQGIDVLFKHTDEGLNAMPARGGCFECSDKQLMLAIAAMLPNNLPSQYPLLPEVGGKGPAEPVPAKAWERMRGHE